jgi:tRNA-splicing ligase RtcB (3'-phosphate/5'-hydroxy nucleic acid ligase)
MINKLKTLIPLHEIEQEAQAQIYKELARPFLKKMAIMPDCHTGYTMPIGGVALLDNVISPEYVGYDEGCGMCCIVTNEDAAVIVGDEQKIFNEIYRKIPVGFNGHDHNKDYVNFTSASGNRDLDQKVRDRLYVQLGTLGSGNHFIEIGESRQGKLAITIHSGSRNIGHSVASYYMKLSKQEDMQLPAGFLSIDSSHGQNFLADMNFCLQYALDNRKEMMKVVLDILRLPLKLMKVMINENHNHALVTPDGILHRKGATPAEKGQLGVIPGNMRDGVYITMGLGNTVYLESAPHGAGRKFSRKKAKESIELVDFQKAMKGITAKIDRGTLDEAPMAYKNLHDVVNRTEGIVVDVVDHITSLINIKG